MTRVYTGDWFSFFAQHDGMTSAALRVATRYYGRLRLAAFIPDDFFEGYAALLKKLFAQKLTGDALEDAIRLIGNEVVPLHERFIQDLIARTPRTVHQSLKDRLGLKRDQLERVKGSLVDSQKAVAFPYPLASTRDHVLLHIHTMVGSYVDKSFPTLGKMFKTQILIDRAKVEVLVNRALKKLTPEVRAAIDADDLGGRNSKLQYDFYQEHVDKSIARLIKKEKIVIDWISWFERVRDSLAANYGEPLLHTVDLHGMTVVVNDAVITTKEHAAYIGLLDKAYQLLKRKKLDRAWHGNVFIECDSCGGHTDAGGKVEGHYYIGKDWVQIYARPSPKVVHYMVHELGHRYWFKSMTQGQRARFEAYVRAHESEKGQRDRVPSVLESKVLEAAKKRIEDGRVEAQGYVDRMERAELTRATPPSQFARRLENASIFVLDMPAAAKVVSDLEMPESATAPFREMVAAADDAGRHLMAFPDLLAATQLRFTDDATFADAIGKALGEWCSQAREVIDVAASRARRFAIQSFTDYNEVGEAKRKEHDEKRQRAWDADQREVLPVSEYGKTNIAEAFAEAFAWYVLDREMTSDQKGIFESVLLRQDRAAARVACRWTQCPRGGPPLFLFGGRSSHHTAAATSLPTSFPASEIGLMTKDEFLAFMNPKGKHHPSDAYEVTLMRMNEDHGPLVGTVGHGSEAIQVQKRSEGYELTMDGKLIGVIHEGIAYYDNPRMRKRIPTGVPGRQRDEYTDLGIQGYRHVKYLSEVTPLVSPRAKLNEAAYPVVLQRLLVKGEAMALRAEKKPETDKGTSLVILNSRGLIVARGSNEWGATLLQVVEEYRGKGLGKILGRYWFEYNPTWESGGFTSSGEAATIARWKDRVREFAANGWYTQLVRDGQLTEARVKEILKDVGSRPPPRPQAEPERAKATGKTMVFADDVTFVVYDAAFLEEPDEKFIHGYGFFRDNHRGTYLYRIEYDRPYAKLVTSVALQMAKDNGDTLYDGAADGISDLLEDVESIPGVERDGDYLTVTRNLLPLKTLAQVERLTRKKVDPYQEKYHQLLEMAEGKW